MAMARLVLHPNAYLSETRNIRRGLISRTKILRILEGNCTNANTLAEESKLSYSVVLHHLRLLATENLVTCNRGRKPYFWKLTGMGQQRLKPT